MIRIIGILVFVGLILLKPMTQFSWEVWYFSNIEYASEELCENVEIPEMECNGKCFLSKQLKAAELEKETNEDKAPIQPIQVKEEHQIINDIFTCCNFTLIREDLNKPFVHSEEKLRHSSKDIFHPPQA